MVAVGGRRKHIAALADEKLLQPPGAKLNIITGQPQVNALPSPRIRLVYESFFEHLDVDVVKPDGRHYYGHSHYANSSDTEAEYMRIRRIGGHYLHLKTYLNGCNRSKFGRFQVARRELLWAGAKSNVVYVLGGCPLRSFSDVHCGRPVA